MRIGVSVLCASILVSTSLLVAPKRISGQEQGGHRHFLIYIGTYGKKTQGIYAYRVDADMSNAIDLGLAAETINPFALAVTPDRHYLYATNMGHQYKGEASGSVTAFSINEKTGKLTTIDQIASEGADPAYISLDKTGHFAFIANYTGGSVAVLSINRDGSLGTVLSFHQHMGSGADPKRQAAPHPHSIGSSPDNRYVLSADLGLDKLFVYHFDQESGALSPDVPPYASLAPASGPRHFVFSPNGKFVYVIGEMSSTVTVLSYDGAMGTLRPVQTVSTLPKEFVESNTGAEIQIANSGKFLYASNRGDDTIAVFTVDAESGKIAPIEYVPVGGKTPGMIALDPSGSYLLSANKDSDDVTIFRVNRRTGELTASGGPLSAPDPAYISIIPVE